MTDALLDSRSSGFLVVAYHGCDAVVRDDLVRGRIQCLRPSDNNYDWLGPGFYVFENDPVRAQKLAAASNAHPEKLYTKEPIGTPAVVGVVLRIQRWLDMTTQEGLQRFADSYEVLRDLLDDDEMAQLSNDAADRSDSEFILRRLDNSVFRTLHQIHDEAYEGMFYQAVRGAFPQGGFITDHSFRTDSHIQIAVRDNTCVVGWFLPEGAKLMTDEEYAEAQRMLQAARRARKPRKRAT